MILDFDLDLFKHRLAETIAWCVPRFSMDNIENSLRTPPIFLEHEKYEFIHPFQRQEIDIFADTVYAKRAKAVSVDIAENIQSELSGGRLLLFYMSNSTCDGIGPIESNGFIDICNFPPWDTWIYHGIECGKFIRAFPQDIRDIEYIISWVPEEMIPLIDETIKTLAEQCLQWVEDDYYNLSFIDLLRS
jgi:hypothetical protein